jgi:hypothetical protein
MLPCKVEIDLMTIALFGWVRWVFGMMEFLFHPGILQRLTVHQDIMQKQD